VLAEILSAESDPIAAADKHINMVQNSTETATVMAAPSCVLFGEFYVNADTSYQAASMLLLLLLSLLLLQALCRCTCCCQRAPCCGSPSSQTQSGRRGGATSGTVIFGTCCICRTSTWVSSTRIVATTDVCRLGKRCAQVCKSWSQPLTQSQVQPPLHHRLSEGCSWLPLLPFFKTAAAAG
jgi:hypothetical protein